MYHIEANKKVKKEADILIPQLKIMARRLWYIITWPSAILSILFAIWLVLLVPSWLSQGWMHIKITFVVLLIFYHLKTHKMFLKLQKDQIKYSSMYVRIWNEGATILLFSIVFLVILKDSLSWIWGLTGLIALGLLLILGIRIYNKIRKDE